MEYRKTTAATAKTNGRLSSVSPTSSASSGNPSSIPPQVILSPCAACKILRRRCVENCLLAPYFPPTDPLKFTTAHRVFGASNSS
ncbi:UNVERIFIED_CONTAM: LOB domain-containing protein 1 [Sesamum calycinum]|uniref:LOB domain-containing protein 1 n=1 Tax=Sesamum calycinum TaxID=2727403 RepID=A0AAW2RQY7_9LAMI